ncbi:MAG: PilN domain-containing protein [Clostridia bacterium]|jgi:Tfp pilus assembly protein PilN|nr:PilN domain-containing protein [Clostridia bacterium]
MKKLNLLPPELQKQHEVDIKLLLTKALVLLGLVLTLSLLGFGQYKLLDLEKQTANLEMQRQELLPYQQTAQQLEKRQSEVKNKLAEIASVVPPIVKSSHLLKQIDEVMPTGVWLTRVELTVSDETGGQQLSLNLIGYSVSVNSVALFSYHLGRLTDFKQIAVEYASFVEISGMDLVEFRLTSTLFP